MKDSTKTKKTIAPSSTAPTASSSAKARVAMPEKGTLVKKTGNAKGGTDPYAQAKPSRTNVTSQGARGGARYGINVKYQAAVAPEAGATQSNGRIFKSALNRQSPEFSAGMVDHN
jgi:hypothetical protein